MKRNNEPNKQNGGQLPLKSGKPILPSESNTVCRDYVWGKCTKFAQCKFSHDCDIETMKNVIQFCHDYQNPTGCQRPNCTYLHSSSAEEKLFREAGQLPSELAKRHAQMKAASANMSRKMVGDSYMNKPPPPPPELQPPPPPPPPVAAPMFHVPRWFPPPPPPPPPPKEPSPPRTYTGPPPKPAPVYIPQQPPPHLPLIDTSRPPPPLPTNLTQIKNGSLKRSLPDPCEAGPSKSRKSPKCETSTCENCTQWDIRNLILEAELNEKIAEKACIMLKYEKKRSESSNLMEILTRYFEDTSSSQINPLSYTSDMREIFSSCLNSVQSDIPSSILGDLSPPREVFPRNDQSDLLRAFLSNCVTDLPDVTTNTSSSSQMLRRISELLKETEPSTSSNGNSIRNGLERLLASELVPGSLGMPSVPATAPPPFPSTSALAHTAVPPPTHVPPPPTHPPYPQPFRPVDNQLQYPYTFATNLNNGATENPLHKTNSSGTSSIPAATLPPSFCNQNNYHYNMMGRPPPFQ